MAEEGKNLSGKAAEGKQACRENAFQLHYFPEIPLHPNENRQVVSASPVRDLGPRFVRDGACKTAQMPGRRPGTSDGHQTHTSSAKTIEDIETEAYIRGFNKGEKAGFEAAGDKIASFQAMLTDAIEELARIQKQIRHDTEKEVVELALAVAERIVRQELMSNRASIVNVVQEALQKVEHQQAVVLKMNPADMQFLDPSRLPFTDTAGQSNNIRIRIEADETITRGGCFIETESGDVDARIETQIDIIKAAFLEKLG